MVRGSNSSCCDSTALTPSTSAALLTARAVRTRKICGATRPVIDGLETRTLFGLDPNNPSGGGPPPCPPPATGPNSGGTNASANAGTGGASTEAPVGASSGVPIIQTTDLVSNAFGMPWGTTRTWVGFNESGRIGNGWMIADMPYLVVNAGDNGGHHSAETVSLIIGGNAREKFVATGGGNQVDGYSSYENVYFTQSTLTFTPPVDDPMLGKLPGEFVYTDSKGNVTTFYDLPRYVDINPFYDAISPTQWIEYYPYETHVTGLEGYHLQDTNRWQSVEDGLDTTAEWYQFGAFKSFTDSSGKVKVTNTFDYSGGLTPHLESQTITRTDGSGAFERFVYEYEEVENTETGASAFLISTVTMSRATGSAGYTAPGSGWADIRAAEYDYYTGMEFVSGPKSAPRADWADGRLGDLKLVTILDFQRNPSGDVVDQKYYRYNKFHGKIADTLLDRGPTNILTANNDSEANGTGGGDDSFPAVFSGPQGDDNHVWSGLKMSIEGASFARLKAFNASYEQVPNNDSNATDSDGDGDAYNEDIVAYADNFFWYGDRYDASEVEHAL